MHCSGLQGEAEDLIRLTLASCFVLDTTATGVLMPMTDAAYYLGFSLPPDPENLEFPPTRLGEKFSAQEEIVVRVQMRVNACSDVLLPCLKRKL
jgi:hypothetical protein